MRRLIAVSLFFAFAAVCSAQMKFNQVTPISMTYKNTTKNSSLMQQKGIIQLQELKPKIVPGLNFSVLQKELDEKHKEDTAFHPLAKAIPVNIDVIKEGYWEEIAEKGKVCRFKLHIENSSAVILTFDRFRIPKGSSLLIFNNDGMVLGPLTSELNKPSKKFMTGILQGPELIFEYCEKAGSNERAEISINNIGIVYKYDYDRKEKLNSKNSDEILGIPPMPVDAGSDYVNGVREGYMAMCKVVDPVNFSDPIGKIVTSACQYVFYGGGYFNSKPAVLLKGNDDCTPYIATAGHVTWPTNNTEEYSIIRFNWVRRLPANAPPEAGNRNWDNCYYPDYGYNNPQWNNTIDFSRVVDYLGTTLMRFFPCFRDVSILKINSNLVHKVWMSGWDARADLDGNMDNNTAVALSFYGGVPLMYADGHLSNGNSDFTFEVGSLPLRAKSGYSGTSIFYPKKTGNNIDEYLYVGPLTTSYYSVTKLYHAYNCSSTGLQAPLETILHDPDNPNEYFQLGQWYIPGNCSPLPECCNFYYATTNFEYSNSNNLCCNTFKLEERMIDNLQPNYTCSTYVLKIFHDYDLMNPVSFDIIREDNSVIQSSVPQDIINFNDFKGKIKRYRLCETLPSNSTSMAKKYLIKFYANENGTEVGTCEKDMYFTCSKECYCDADRYKIELVKKETSDDKKCCYTATIYKLNDSHDQFTCPEHNYIGDRLTCSSTFIQAWAVNRYAEPSSDNWCYPYRNFRLISNYWYDGTGLSDNPTLDPNQDKAVIDDICIENPGENYIIFRFHSDPVLSSYPNFPYTMYCEQAVPITLCNCCDAIKLSLVNDDCSNILYRIEQLNSDACGFSSIAIEAIITDYNGNESSLGELENSTDYEYFNGDLTIHKGFAFNTYNTSGNTQKQTLSKIKYRIKFKKQDGSIICSKNIDAPECNDCLDNVSFNFEDAGNCSTRVIVSKSQQVSYQAAIFEKYNTNDGRWTYQDRIDLDGGYGYVELAPGIYRVKFGSNCYFYFMINDCWQCHPEADQVNRDYLWVSIEKIPGSCCYQIKSNQSANVTVDDIDNSSTPPCSLTKDGSSSNYTYSNENCELLCNNSDKEKKLELTFNNVFDFQKCKRIITLPPCIELSKCCEAAQVKVIESPGSNSGEVCCYKFNILNVGCKVAKVKFYKDEINENNLLLTAFTENLDLANLSDYMGWLCFNDDLSSHTIYIVLVDENGAECSGIAPLNLTGCHTREKRCCNAINITNSQIVPSTDCVNCPSDKCCFKFMYSTLPDCEGLPLTIKIIYNSDTLYESTAPETLNQSGTINLCIDRSKLPASPNIQDISVRIDFIVGDNSYCSKEGISLHIDPAQCSTCCNDYALGTIMLVPMGFDPDNPPSNFTCCWGASLSRKIPGSCWQSAYRIHVKDTRPTGEPPIPPPVDEYDMYSYDSTAFIFGLGGYHCSSYTEPEAMAEIITEITIYDASGNIICDKKSIRSKCGYGSGGWYASSGWTHPRTTDSTNIADEPVNIYSNVLTNLEVIPNPSPEEIIIRYNLNNSTSTKIEISNSLGSVVGNIDDDNTRKGVHSILFSFKNLPSGVYYIKVTTGGFVSSVRVSIIK